MFRRNNLVTMKKIIPALFAAACLFPLAGFTQAHDEAGKPLYYVDSVLVSADQMGYINPRNISSVDIVKDGNGAVYIELKGGTTFLTPEEVVGKYLGREPATASSLLYVIGGKVILDPSQVKIDESYIKEVTQSSLIEAVYLDPSLQKMQVISIQLSPDGDEKELRIRGLAQTD